MLERAKREISIAKETAIKELYIQAAAHSPPTWRRKVLGARSIPRTTSA